jgi:hypothetical protein
MPSKPILQACSTAAGRSRQPHAHCTECRHPSASAVCRATASGFAASRRAHQCHGPREGRTRMRVLPSPRWPAVRWPGLLSTLAPANRTRTNRFLGIEKHSGASDPCARNRNSNEAPVNRVEDQGYHCEPHRLIDQHTRPVLFL